METTGFIIEVKNLGYEVEIFDNFISITDDYSERYATIETDTILGIDTDFDTFKSLDDYDKKVLCTLILEYAKTPLEKRDIEKKYIYKFPFDVIYETKKDLYIFRILEGGLNLSNAEIHDPEINSRYHFTDKEVEQFTGKEKALFNVCEKVEVF